MKRGSRCWLFVVYRRKFLRTLRWSHVPLVLFLSCFVFVFLLGNLLFFNSIRLYRSIHCCSHSSDVIVSLTSTPERFHRDLPLTIHSLLSQTYLPRQIRLRLSSTSNLTVAQLKKTLQSFDSSADLHERFDQLIRIDDEPEDYGPATKFLPIIREFHRSNDSQLQQQRILICDDDQYYHHQTVATLSFYSDKYPNSIVGLRGWRSEAARFHSPIDRSTSLSLSSSSRGSGLRRARWRKSKHTSCGALCKPRRTLWGGNSHCESRLSAPPVLLQLSTLRRVSSSTTRRSACRRYLDQRSCSATKRLAIRRSLLLLADQRSQPSRSS